MLAFDFAPLNYYLSIAFYEVPGTIVPFPYGEGTLIGCLEKTQAANIFGCSTFYTKCKFSKYISTVKCDWSDLTMPCCLPYTGDSYRMLVNTKFDQYELINWYPQSYAETGSTTTIDLSSIYDEITAIFSPPEPGIAHFRVTDTRLKRYINIAVVCHPMIFNSYGTYNSITAKSRTFEYHIGAANIPTGVTNFSGSGSSSYFVVGSVDPDTGETYGNINFDTYGWEITPPSQIVHVNDIFKFNINGSFNSPYWTNIAHWKFRDTDKVDILSVGADGSITLKALATTGGVYTPGILVDTFCNYGYCSVRIDP